MRKSLYDIYLAERAFRADALVIDRDDLTESDYMRRMLAQEAAELMLGRIHVEEVRHKNGYAICRTDIRKFIVRNKAMFIEMRKACGKEAKKMTAEQFCFGIMGNILNGNAITEAYEILLRHLSK